MPICTTCTHPVAYLYTIYESAYNLRFEQCSECGAFADPYVEYDSLTLLLDLVLLKRGVFRHLLYNRGAPPRKMVGDKEPGLSVRGYDKGMRRWSLIFRLGGALTLLDAFIRWSYLNTRRATEPSPWSEETYKNFLRVLVGCLIETVAFHFGIMISCHVVLKCLDGVQRWRCKPTKKSDIRNQFRLSLIPLSLFYSSLIKLFLLLLLTIWLPTSSHQSNADSSLHERFTERGSASGILLRFDDDSLDREWVVRNVLGGMSAGFGLRVILDIYPMFIIVIIISGWIAKNAAAGLISEWVGGDERTGAVWLAYTLP